MTTSGTYAYTPNLDDLLTEAWERIGKSPALLNGEIARSAKRSIQLMLLDWTNRGLNLWQVQRQAPTCGVGSNTVTLTSNTVDVLDAIVTVSSVDRPLMPISRTDFLNIPVKSIPGPPTQYWVDRVTPAPILRLYPTPDQAYLLTLNTIMQPQDVTGLLQTADAPVLWSEAIAAGLAARMAVKFAPDRLEILAPLAAEAYRNAAGEERERVPLTVIPDNWATL